MKQLTVYKVKGKGSNLEFLFKYDLNGVLREFKIEDGDLTNEQMMWLYSQNFPATEKLIIDNWMKLEKYKKRFDIQKSPPDLSFEAFWGIWNLKIKKEKSEIAWNKLNDTDKIKCFLNHKRYQDHLAKTGQAKAHLVTWLNQKRYNDEY